MHDAVIPKSYGFLLVPGFSMVALSCAVDALRSANLEAEDTIFSWVLIAENAGPVYSSSGIALKCNDLNQASAVDAIAVCGGDQSHNFNSTKVDNWLKLCARDSKMIGAISDGAYVVAASGLFDQCRSTIHWKCQLGYRERHPDLKITTAILEVDANRFSCAGGTSSLDLMLHFIALALNAGIAGRVAANYFHDTIRSDDQLQPMASGFIYAARDENLSRALVLMAANIEDPLPLKHIAEILGTNHRQLDRMFQRYFSTTPGHYYRNMRLTRAAGLLRQTGLSISEIAFGCGFQSSSHLARFFKRKYSNTPLQYRVQG